MADDSHGSFVWFDLMTPDTAAAIDFYGKIVGWGTQVMEMADGNYTMWTNGEKPLGGVVELTPEMAPPGTPPHWIAYVSMPDLDAAAAKVADLGGTVIKPPQDIPDIGRFAIIADPQGAVIALYTSATDAPAEAGPPKVGEFSWHELITTDYAAAIDFYSALFGWDKMEAMDMGPAGIYQIYGRNGMPLGGMFNRMPDMPPGPPAWLYYAKVDDVDAKAEEVKAAGGQVMNGPMEVPGGDRIVQCMDPQGAAFALHSTKS